MHRILKRTILLFGLALLTGCAAARRYQPVPVAASAGASRLESRSLAATGLRSFLEKTLGSQVAPWPLKTWNLETLSIAGLYFHPTLDVARARADTAAAAMVTAGARPNPTFSVAPGIPSPYLVTLDFAVPIETAGKRGYRSQIAHELDQAARLDLADSAWTIRNGIRVALLNYLVASRSLELIRSEEQARKDQVAILEQIQSVGEISRLNVDPARIELSRIQVAIRTTEGQVDEAKAALAGAVGIPTAGLEPADFSWPGLDTPPVTESLSPLEIQRAAVLNRLDIRRSLAQYAAAEAAVRLEIAKQYPDFNLGPGYTFEERHSFFTVGFSATIPIFNRNQGPIAEAEARRKEAGAVFLQTQAQVIARSERALAAYAAALKEMAEAQSLYQLQETQLETIQQAIRAGADTQLSLDGVRVQLSILARARLDAVGRAQLALGNLEDAVQRPLAPGEAFAINAESPALSILTEDQNR